MPHNQENNGIVIKKSRSIYFKYACFILCILPFAHAFNYVFTAFTKENIDPLLILGPVPGMIVIAYLIYVSYAHTQVHLKVTNEFIFYTGYTTSIFPEKIQATIPLSDIKEISTYLTRPTYLTRKFKDSITFLHITRNDASDISVNVSSLSKKHLFNVLLQQMSLYIQNCQFPNSAEDITIKINTPKFFKKHASAYINGTGIHLDPVISENIITAKKGSLLSLNYSNKFIMCYLEENCNYSIETFNNNTFVKTTDPY